LHKTHAHTNDIFAMVATTRGLMGVAVLVGGAAAATASNSSGPTVGYYSWK
jgi:sulfite reductase beta subunit-like hemoprotein